MQVPADSANDFIALELARLAANRIIEKPACLREGLARVVRWRGRAAGGGRAAAFAEWEEIIRTKTPGEIAALLTAEGHEAARLRSSMPFIQPPFFTEAERLAVIARAFET